MGTISMSRKERKRLEAFSRVKMGGMTLVEASEVLGLSYRQTKRAWSRYQNEGDAGLVHRLRGRAPNRHAPEKTKQRSLALYRQRYADYGATLAAECLEKEDGVKVSVTTLRRWLLQAGLLDRRASGLCIVGGGRGANIWARWCRWTVPFTTGSRGDAAGRR